MEELLFKKKNYFFMFEQVSSIFKYTELFVVPGGARLGVGSAPTCLCTCAHLSVDILSLAAVVQAQQQVPATRVVVVADAFRFYYQLRYWKIKQLRRCKLARKIIESATNYNQLQFRR